MKIKTRIPSPLLSVKTIKTHLTRHLMRTFHFRTPVLHRCQLRGIIWAVALKALFKSFMKILRKMLTGSQQLSNTLIGCRCCSSSLLCCSLGSILGSPSSLCSARSSSCDRLMFHHVHRDFLSSG